jgi:hypothetical protein
MDPQPESDAKNASPTIPEGKAELTARLWPFEHGRSTLFELAVELSGLADPKAHVSDGFAAEA